MSNGEMPDYEYRANKTGQPLLLTRSARRARLNAGGTYFRAREPGVLGNNISVEVLEYISEIPGEVGQKKAKCIVTNHNLKTAENVLGPVKTNVLEHNLKWNQFVKIALSDQPKNIQLFKIDYRFLSSDIFEQNLGIFTSGATFYVKDVLAAKLTVIDEEITPTSVIIIKPRYKTYDLLPLEVPSTTSPGITLVGWDIEDLRTKINASDPWVEMLERSGPDPVTGVAPLPKFDAQDDDIDEPVLLSFEEQQLTGGDGLPLFPSRQETGPTRSLIHLNYSEQYNGVMGVSNLVYEWAGESTAIGAWQKY